jgi:hypothetical protein
MTVRFLTLLRSTESHGFPPQALTDAGARAAQPRGLPGAGVLPSGSQPSEHDEERPLRSRDAQVIDGVEGTPPGTGTLNPRIKSRLGLMPDRDGECRPVPFGLVRGMVDVSDRVGIAA